MNKAWLKHFQLLVLVPLACLNAGAATTYTYDSLNRLTAVTYDTGASQTYTYDATGNRLSLAITAPPAVGSVPNAFAFTPQTGVPVGSIAVSNTVTITGITTPLAISISGGEYSIDGGAFTAAAGSLSNGQTVTVRLTAAASYGTTTSALLTVGAATGSFNVTTQATPATLSPSSLSFGSQALGTTSAAQTVTLTNSGAAAISLGAIAISGDFAQTSTCGAALAGGANCTIVVTFTPTTTGNLIGRLSVGTDAAGGANSVALSGLGAASDGSRTLAQGWNLLGNGMDQPISVATRFGDANAITSVWKWDAANYRWLIYSPLLDAATLQTYAASHGYAVLSQVAPGEGYWVNAKQAAVLAEQAGSVFVLTAANLTAGWNLVATGRDVSPSAFNQSLSLTPPAPNVIPQNMVSLWAWDNPSSAWYFYAPGLEAQGGTALSDYIAAHGYLDFSQHGKTLGNGAGFWVKRP